MTVSNIELIDIDKELCRLWDEEMGKNRIRACLFTLIVYTKKIKSAFFYEDLIKKVIGKFPCRILWIAEEANETEEYLKTSVSSECFGKGEGEIQLFCEQIKIEVGGNLRKRVPYIILPHIVPDLPTYIFWTQDPSLENEILPQLEKVADRIIFDPEEAVDLQSFSKTILEIINKFSKRISDLNWVAVRGWRESFRNVFNTPPLLLQLSKSRKIKITYNRNPTEHCKFTEIRSAYFQGWLAAQLKWRFKTFAMEDSLIRILYSSDDNDVTILLVPRQESALPPGAILEVEIQSDLNGSQYLFKRIGSSRQVAVQFSDQERCDLPYNIYLSGFKPGYELVEEIFYETTGEHYKNMLQLLSQIPWKHNATI